MADLFRLTETCARVSASGDQPLYNAVDVLQYDVLDVLVTTTFGPGSSPSLTLSLISGMQTATPDNWIQVSSATLPTLNATTKVGSATFDGGFFRYIRWRAVLGPLAAYAQFTIEIVGRKTG